VSPLLRRRPTACAAIAALGLLAGCIAHGDPSATHAAECWGSQAEDCAARMAPRAARLGMADGDHDALLKGGACGSSLDCDGVALTTGDDDDATTSGIDAADPAHTDPGEDITQAGPGDDDQGQGEPITARRDDDDATTPVNVQPPDPVSNDRPTSCAGLNLEVVAQKGQLSGSETTCLRDMALKYEPLAVSDFTAIQVAVLGLYNARDPQWQSAVERALSYSELQYSPRLNFAGLKPAYDQGRYGTVVRRANTVWTNLDKGLRLTAADRTFVSEFACRAGVQLHLQGQTSDDPERWCSIWVDRLEHEGSDASEARSLLEQVE